MQVAAAAAAARKIQLHPVKHPTLLVKEAEIILLGMYVLI